MIVECAFINNIMHMDMVIWMRIMNYILSVYLVLFLLFVSSIFISQAMKRPLTNHKQILIYFLFDNDYAQRIIEEKKKNEA